MFGIEIKDLNIVNLAGQRPVEWQVTGRVTQISTGSISATCDNEQYVHCSSKMPPPFILWL